MDGKTILVSGGAGFIGSHLCRRLLNQGAHVICLDNLLTGQRQTVDALSTSSRFTFIEHDVIAPIVLKVDAIYNLACAASPKHYQRQPIHTMQTCVLGALNMLQLARQCAAPILQASTSEVYGQPLVHPQAEDYLGNVNPIGPRACYDEGKRAAETLFHDFHRRYATRIRVARIFNTYGPGMLPDDGRVVSNFIVQALQKAPITLFGDGLQTRSFCYVDDLVDGLLALMNTPTEIEGPINFGNPQEFSVRDLAEMVLRLTGSSSSCVNNPLPPDDPTRRRPDITRAQRLLGWQPKVGIFTGLKQTIEYFSTRRESSAHRPPIGADHGVGRS